MNNINIIKPIPPHRQREIMKWLRISILSCTLLTLGILTLQTRQVYQWLKIKKEHKQFLKHGCNFNQATREQSTLKQKETVLKEKTDLITKWTNKPHTPLAYIRALNDLEKNGTHIESFIVAGNNIELSARCANERTARSCLETFSDLPQISSIKISSLRPCTKHNAAGCIIHAKGAIKIS